MQQLGKGDLEDNNEQWIIWPTCNQCFPILDPWAVAWPIIKALALAAVVLVPLAALVGYIEGRARRGRRHLPRGRRR